MTSVGKKASLSPIMTPNSRTLLGSKPIELPLPNGRHECGKTWGTQQRSAFSFEKDYNTHTMKSKRTSFILLALGSLLSLSACFSDLNSDSQSSSSSSKESTQYSSNSEESSISSEKESTSEFSSESSSSSVSEIENSSVFSSESSSSSSEISRLPYEEKDNNEWPTSKKTYRIVPQIISGDSFTVYNVKYDTHDYLAYPTTLTIKKTDYCLTYETVALYYQAFGEFPPNYTFDKSSVVRNSDYRYVSVYSKGSYGGSNDYTTKLGSFRNSTGDYYELDIALDDSYYGSRRGAARLVIVADGIREYDDDSPVCYYTKDHYADFVEFYNYADGWSEEFAGIYNKSGSYENSPETDISRPSPTTIAPTYLS